jgi:hypothetical protein
MDETGIVAGKEDDRRCEFFGLPPGHPAGFIKLTAQPTLILAVGRPSHAESVSRTLLNVINKSVLREACLHPNV